MRSAQIPASCPSCGAIFASRAFAIGGNVKNLTLSGNKETCPNCGGWANIADGVFDIADNVISVVRAPQITKAMLEAFQKAVAAAYDTRQSADELASEVEKIDPSFGDVVRASGQNNSLYLAGLLIILTAIRSCAVNIDIDGNQLIEQLQDSPPTEITSNNPED